MPASSAGHDYNYVIRRGADGGQGVWVCLVDPVGPDSVAVVGYHWLGSLKRDRRLNGEPNSYALELDLAPGFHL